MSKECPHDFRKNPVTNEVRCWLCDEEVRPPMKTNDDKAMTPEEIPSYESMKSIDEFVADILDFLDFEYADDGEKNMVADVVKDMKNRELALARKVQAECAKAVCEWCEYGYPRHYEENPPMEGEEPHWFHWSPTEDNNKLFCQATDIHALSDEKLLEVTG